MKKLFIILIISGFWFACTKEEVISTNTPDLPENPFDNTGSVDPNDPNPDSSSLLGIHKYILTSQCAMEGCHDGAFEPDFRTVQSAYSTLVYHGIVKNNAAGTFRYRVIPFDTANSLLHERITNCCFVNNNDIMPQSTQTRMAEGNIKAIEKWILSGAPDIYGNVASSPPSAEPFLYDIGMLAWKSMPTEDTSKMLNRPSNREGGLYYNPFLVNKTDTFSVWFDVRDLNSNLDTLYGNDPSLTNLQIKFSTDLNFGSNVSTYPLQVTTNAFGYPFPIPGLHYYINYTDTDGLPYSSGQVVYFRIYIQDADHSKQTEIFNSNVPPQIHGIFSFKIQ